MLHKQVAVVENRIRGLQEHPTTDSMRYYDTTITHAIVIYAVSVLP